MTIELPPLPHMPRDKAAIVEARERILQARIAELEAENSQLRTDIDDDTQLIRDLQAALDAAMAKGEKP